MTVQSRGQVERDRGEVIIPGYRSGGEAPGKSHTGITDITDWIRNRNGKLHRRQEVSVCPVLGTSLGGPSVVPSVLVPSAIPPIEGGQGKDK